MTIRFAAHAAKEDQMIYPTRTIEVFSRDNDHCKRLKDPTTENLYHLEAFLPFTEAVKLEKGNANLRPPSELKKPFQDMIASVEDDPASFHKKNRGITYLCDKFEFDNSKKRLQVKVPIFLNFSTDNSTEADEKTKKSDRRH